MLGRLGSGVVAVGCCRVVGLVACVGRRSVWARLLGVILGWVLVDVGFSLAGRSGLERRAVVLGGGREELLVGLGVLAGGGVGCGCG